MIDGRRIKYVRKRAGGMKGPAMTNKYEIIFGHAGANHHSFVFMLARRA